jgi:predicted transcriptional regulator
MTITIDVPDEVKTEVEEAAKSVNLSLSDFAQLALIQSLARTLKDPRLEKLAVAAPGDGWERLKQRIPDAPPVPGDELP